MPIKKCQNEGKPGYKWGDQGKCYIYNPNDESSIKDAKKSATAQGVAIGDLESNKIAEFREMFAAQKVSFDFDGTLTVDNVKKIASDLVDNGVSVYIISARDSNVGLLNTAKELGIPLTHVFATGSNVAKINKIKELGITKHYDNNADVIKAVKGIGKIGKKV